VDSSPDFFGKAAECAGKMRYPFPGGYGTFVHAQSLMGFDDTSPRKLTRVETEQTERLKARFFATALVSLYVE
jgi:hypothetical protein